MPSPAHPLCLSLFRFPLMADHEFSMSLWYVLLSVCISVFVCMSISVALYVSAPLSLYPLALSPLLSHTCLPNVSTFSMPSHFLFSLSMLASSYLIPISVSHFSVVSTPQLRRIICDFFRSETLPLSKSILSAIDFSHESIDWAHLPGNWMRGRKQDCLHFYFGLYLKPASFTCSIQLVGNVIPFLA